MSNNSWWIYDNEDIYERVKVAYNVMLTNNIPCPTSEFIDEHKIIIMQEVKGNHLKHCNDKGCWQQVGRILRRLHQTGYIHGDFHTENVIVDGSEVTFIDFEEMIVGDPVYDLAEIYSDAIRNNQLTLFFQLIKGYGLSKHLLTGIENYVLLIQKRNEDYVEWKKNAK